MDVQETARETQTEASVRFAMQGEVARPALIASAIARLDENVDRAAKAVAMLEERIGSVITGGGVESAGAGDTMPSAGVALADHLNATGDRLGYVAARLEDLHNRVEL